MTTTKLKAGTSFFLTLIAISFWGCKDHVSQVNPQMANVPIYKSYDDMRSPVTMGTVNGLKRPGKIYFKDDHIFVSEIGKGIHIIDNANPSAPVNIAFIDIPGNVDIVIKDNILYADNFTDLIVMDVSNLSNAELITRFENVFPYALPPYDESFPIAEIDQTKGVIIGWKLEPADRVCRDAECGSQFPVWPSFAFSDMQTQSFSSSNSNQSFGRRVSGTGGSMARFALNGNYMYSVNSQDLTVFDISIPRAPVVLDKITIGMDIETIFPYKENLFIGSETGMFIYDVSNPANPNYISQFSHVRSCDPVVVEGDYAYVTMRSGGGCGGWTNELNVVDISTLSNPTLVRTVLMDNPHGLGIDSDKLFVCDGDAGLKIYSATNPYSISLLETKSNINAFDVIAIDNVLMMIGADGLYQYDYSNINSLALLSVIPVN
ncbi:MAG: hypothetical protein JKY18_12650 [Flavobacteriales bacterium]|nr:hypothetical protein [Flavobacteriales bacterium]